MKRFLSRLLHAFFPSHCIYCGELTAPDMHCCDDCREKLVTADENGTVKGFVSGLTEHKWFYLADLWVAEAYRGHGLGTELLCRMEEKAKAVGMTQIYTWTTGPRNMRFYEKCGYQRFVVFEDFCEVPGYHRVGYKKDL